MYDAFWICVAPPPGAVADSVTGQLVVSSVPPVCDPSRSAAMGAVCVYNASRATPAPAVNASVRYLWAVCS